MTLIDLFSGCGGFSLGAHQAGLQVAAAFDIDETLTSSFAYNFPRTRLVLGDISRLTGEKVRDYAGPQIDGIIGGPPCQGFSDIGRRQLDDPRRALVNHFFRVVDEVQPSFFVMENVRGLAYPNSRGVLDAAMKIVSDRYAILGPHVLDAADFGAATRRRRLFVVGIHKDRGEALTLANIAAHQRQPSTVRAAIGDLEGAEEISEEEGFDVWRIRKMGRPSSYASTLRAPDGRFTGHKTTKHTAEVEKRFARVLNGAIDTIGRHPRLDWFEQCPTLRAGTGSDRGSYQAVRPIHPDLPRVITVREGARLQGFPDWHRFHPTVWHSFRMIGNSVSPIIAHSIFSAIKANLVSIGQSERLVA